MRDIGVQFVLNVRC